MSEYTPNKAKWNVLVVREDKQFVKRELETEEDAKRWILEHGRPGCIYETDHIHEGTGIRMRRK